MTEALAFHPLAAIFPLLDGDEFSALVEDIQLHGQREPITVYDGMILDGRNRYRACREAGVDARLELYEGDDPVGYVISLNLRRRHLDESQRAMVAAKLATLQHGGNRKSPIGDLKQRDAAELLNVGKRSVERAREVLDEGAAELVHAVERGTASVSAAADLASLPQERQTEIVARGEKEILAAAKQIRSEKADARREERTQKLIELSNANSPLPRDRKYPIIYADPPWQYDHMISVSREIENQYPTMDIESICVIDVANLCTPDAMLFLWVPPSFLHKGIRVIEAWGFSYLTSMIWDKQTVGMGYYARQRHEHLLLASRGKPIVPDPSTLSPSVISVPRGSHSEKPSEFYEVIERMYPTFPKIELFARGERDGWDCWGNQAATKAA